MNHAMSIRNLFISAVFACAALAPGLAHADATCSSLTSSKLSYLQQHHGGWQYELTRTGDGGDITYARGTLYLSGSYLYDSGAQYLFSDRYDGYSNGQNFSVNGHEQIQVWVNQAGQLWIYNNNYSYWVLSAGDMSCTGGIMYKYINGALYTLAFRPWLAPIY